MKIKDNKKKVSKEIESTYISIPLTTPTQKRLCKKLISIIDEDCNKVKEVRLSTIGQIQSDNNMKTFTLQVGISSSLEGLKLMKDSFIKIKTHSRNVKIYHNDIL